MPPRLQLTSVTVGTSRPRELLALLRPAARLARHRAGGPERGRARGGGVGADREPEGGAGLRSVSSGSAVTSGPVWPSEPGRQNASQHLDIKVGDLPAAVAWALECGAAEAGFQPQHDVRVMLRPRRASFCLYL